MLKAIRYVIYAFFVVALAGWGYAWVRHDGAVRHVLGEMFGTLPNVGGVSVGGPFVLSDPEGRTVTDASFRGRWVLLYFGYTFCPDVCPTELQTVSNALDLLGPQAGRIVPVFVTVDPGRDQPGVLGTYVKLFDDRLIGLTGTPEQIAAVTKAYRVYYAKANPRDSSTYLMDHSSFLYLVGPDGTFRALFRQGTSAPELAAALKSRMAEAK